MSRTIEKSYHCSCGASSSYIPEPDKPEGWIFFKSTNPEKDDIAVCKDCVLKFEMMYYYMRNKYDKKKPKK